MSAIIAAAEDDPSQSQPLDSRQLKRRFALTLLAGKWERVALIERTEITFGDSLTWIALFVDRLLAQFGEAQPPPFRRVLAFVRDDEGFEKARTRHKLKIVQTVFSPTAMAAKPGPPATWIVPKLVTEADQCAWFETSPEQLAWLADVHGRERTRSGRLRQYLYKWVRKRSGGMRLLEIPKSKLKSMQRRILKDILGCIPAHPAACGFVQNGSVLRFVLPHSGKRFVLRMDLKDFFTSVQISRVHALFRTVGYSENIARVLAGLCTNSVPPDVLAIPEWSDPSAALHKQKMRTPHLPQGAPTSPALANLCAYKLDVRLSALAKRFDWAYTRYADDLLFSGRKGGRAFMAQFQIWAGAIAIEESFELNMRKTRFMPPGARQHAAGLVLNEKPNISRDDFDALKAILHNCVKLGPASQNREQHANFRAHLLGRISYVAQIHPQRGMRLHKMFEAINWA